MVKIQALAILMGMTLMSSCNKFSKSEQKGGDPSTGMGASSAQRKLGEPKQRSLVPFVVSESQERIPSDSKLVHIYIANDSPEMLMQMGVQYDLEQLQQACNNNPNVNWIAFVGSHLAVAPALDGGPLKYAEIPACIGGQFNFLPDYKFAPAPADAPLFPLLAGENVKNAITFARRNFEVGKGVSYFVTVKTHGHRGMPLMGFTPRGAQNKVLRSDEILGQSFKESLQFGSVGWRRSEGRPLVRLSPGEISLRDNYALGNFDIRALEIADRILRPKSSTNSSGDQKIVAGGQGAFGDGSGVDPSGLSEVRGMDRQKFWSQIDEAFTQIFVGMRQKAHVGAVYFDACEPSPLTNDKGQFMNTRSLDYLYRIYSAHGLAWYRTINFDEIYGRLQNLPNDRYPAAFYEEFDKAASSAWIWPSE